MVPPESLDVSYRGMGLVFSRNTLTLTVLLPRVQFIVVVLKLISIYQGHVSHFSVHHNDDDARVYMYANRQFFPLRQRHIHVGSQALPL